MNSALFGCGGLWEAGFAPNQHKKREGSCFVPEVLRGWLQARQMDRRSTKARDQIPERRCRLDELGFVWNTDDALWEAGFAALAQYKSEGNCLVPQKYSKDGYTRLMDRRSTACAKRLPLSENADR